MRKYLSHVTEVTASRILFVSHDPGRDLLADMYHMEDGTHIEPPPSHRFMDPKPGDYLVWERGRKTPRLVPAPEFAKRYGDDIEDHPLLAYAANLAHAAAAMDPKAIYDAWAALPQDYKNLIIRTAGKPVDTGAKR